MVALTISFIACFIGAHAIRGGWDALPIPLSCFREEQSWFLGYAMFALLATMGTLLVRRLLRDRDEEAHYYFCGTGLALLIFVAATPSYGVLHLVASLFVIGGLFGYYALALNEWRHPWLKFHMFAPLVLLAAPPAGSFGSWQKGMILYLVGLINAHYHSLSPPASAPPPRPRRVRALRAATGSVFEPAMESPRRRSVSPARGDSDQSSRSG